MTAPSVAVNVLHLAGGTAGGFASRSGGLGCL
jgi:hypothetical protein